MTFLTYLERTSGNPRYFYSAILLPPVLCLLAAGSTPRFARAWTPLLVGVMVVGLVTSVRMDLNMTYSGIEHEETALSRLTGFDPVLVDGQEELTGDNVANWRAAAEQLDASTSADDLIALDSSAAFQLLLFSRHLDRLAIPEDRDFEQLLSLTDTRFTGLVITGSEKSATGVDRRLEAIVGQNTSDGRRFVKAADLPGVGELYLLEDPTDDPTDDP